jgi:hypothetical protein
MPEAFATESCGGRTKDVTMQISRRMNVIGLGTLSFVVVIMAGVYSFAQDKPQIFQAVARGTGDQLRQSYGVAVEVTIDSYSSPEDQQILMDTFLKDGNRGMVDALKKMPVHGKLWFSGQAPYDVTYIRELPTPAGRKIRLVTNRFVTLADISGNAQQAQDYNLSALELDLSTEKGKSTGVFFPACEFSMEKEKGIKIEAYRNPWRLDEITEKKSR